MNNSILKSVETLRLKQPKLKEEEMGNMERESQDKIEVKKEKENQDKIDKKNKEISQQS